MSYERDSIRRLTGYSYGEQPTATDVIKLNTNENPYPPSPAVAAALASFEAAELRRYPPATAAPLRRLIAERLRLGADQVVTTNGGDEGLRLAIATFVDRGAVLGAVEPGYSLLPVLAGVQDCALQAVPLRVDWMPPEDLAARLNAAGAKLTCIANPHAPSGVLIDAAAVSALAACLNGVLLVDEAYVDFVDPERDHDLTRLVDAHDNLLLLRTLSKGYSLAGLRVGFLMGDVGLIEPIRAKTRDSYNLGALAQTLAVAAFADVEYARRGWRAIRAQRRRLMDGFAELGYQSTDSQANFLLATAPGGAATGAGHAKAVFAGLRERDILVRHFNTPRLANRLRVTVGSAAQNDALLAALAELASGDRPARSVVAPRLRPP